MKRFLSLLLCICVVLGTCPSAFMALADDEITEPGETELSEVVQKGTELPETAPNGAGLPEEAPHGWSGLPETPHGWSGLPEASPNGAGLPETPQGGAGLPEAGPNGAGLPEAPQGEYGEEYGEEPNGAEAPYIDGGTVYDLGNETDTGPVPDEAPPPVGDEPEDNESDVYDTLVFDDENEAQLSSGEYVMDEIIIKFKEPWQVPGKERQLRREIEKAEKIAFVEDLGLYVIKAADLNKNPNAVLNRLKNNKYVEFVEPNYVLKPEMIPNDPGYKNQSAVLTAIGAQNGWEIIMGGGPIVAVVDSGVAQHPDLPPLLGGYSAVAALSPNNDNAGHGTGVAGTIGAVGNNALGGAGINWNASILPVKVDDAVNSISVANTAKGIIWAADNGAKVISISLGTSSDSVTLKNAIDYAYNKGCAIFAAAGNDGSPSVCYPARYENVIGVGASGNGTSRASASSYGAGLDVLAISSYYTTLSNGGYANQTGTSYSTPQVAGLASLVWAVNPKLANSEVYDMIRRGASGNGSYVNNEIGYGVINIGKSVELACAAAGGPEATPSPTPLPTPPAATPTPTPPPPATPTPTPQPTPPPPATPTPTPQPTPPATLPETPQEARTPPIIKLAGFIELSLEYGQAYNEMGYAAYDCKDQDLTGAVKVTNTVDIWTAGLYTVSYEVEDTAGLTARATRTVTVKAPPPATPPPQAPKITINGSNPIVLHATSNTPYKEQSAKAIDFDGSDISNRVTVSGAVNRTAPGTYKLTYSVTSLTSGLTSAAERNVRIVAANEKKDPRVKYGFNGQAKQGAVVTHTGVVAGAAGFMDLQVASIDKNMAITVKLVDTATKKAALTDTFTAAGTKQYKIDQGKYELAVTIDKANGNSKYAINLTMPETAATFTFDEAEVPLAPLTLDEAEVPLAPLTFEEAEVPLTPLTFEEAEIPLAPLSGQPAPLQFAGPPKIAYIGSNPIILHLNSGTLYVEQGARAVDYDGADLSGRVEIVGKPDRGIAATYYIAYRVTNDLGYTAEVIREVRILAPGDYIFGDAEVPLGAATALPPDGPLSGAPTDGHQPVPPPGAPQPISAPPALNQGDKAVVGNCYYVNVRAARSINSRIIAVLPSGAPVDVLDSKAGWYYISCGSAEGWIYGKFVNIA